jgi:V/A-type H+-transporting ATPase subunit C
VKNLFLKTLIKIETDITNIKTFLRIKWIKGEKSLLSLSLVRNGFISAEDFLSIFDEPPEILYHYFEATPYRKLVEDGVSYLYSKGSFTVVEKLSDEHLLEFLRGTKFLAFGVEPLIAYFYVKENEFKIIRMLFVGKLYQIPEDLLKERIPGI